MATALACTSVSRVLWGDFAHPISRTGRMIMHNVLIGRSIASLTFA